MFENCLSIIATLCVQIMLDHDNDEVTANRNETHELL